MHLGRNRWLAGIQLVLLVLPAFVQAAGSAKEAEPPLGATVQGLLAWAEQHNPELAAMQYETEAAEARVQPAGALPEFRRSGWNGRICRAVTPAWCPDRPNRSSTRSRRRCLSGQA